MIDRFIGHASFGDKLTESSYSFSRIDSYRSHASFKDWQAHGSHASFRDWQSHRPHLLQWEWQTQRLQNFFTGIERYIGHAFFTGTGRHRSHAPRRIEQWKEGMINFEKQKQNAFLSLIYVHTFSWTILQLSTDACILFQAMMFALLFLLYSPSSFRTFAAISGNTTA